jgi:2-polyprenyl-3-methyl-5-hydroxy-6-metoxy-1,4-benzoquinol methylase
MNIDLKNKNITNKERNEIERLLNNINNGISTELEQIWYLMDLVWDEHGCDNKNLNWKSIGQFYSHPVWLLNGLYIEKDEVSMGHRIAISNWVVKKEFNKVVDYGGGFGTLARLIAEKNSQIVVDIYEPHPSDFGLRRVNSFSNIKMVEEFNDNYDCLVSTDVLEHVDDPLKDFSRMVGVVKMGGYLAVANCFHPVIKCHLPQNFHFRFTFNVFARLMGLKVEGVLEGSHATIFQKVDVRRVNWKLIRAMEFASKISFSAISVLLPILRPIKRVFG